MSHAERRQHEVTAACADVHCHTHNVDELVELAASIVCGECGHVFKDGDDLLAVTRKRWGQRLPDVYACPYCTHDL